jgi:signal transduction histidine kinase
MPILTFAIAKHRLFNIKVLTTEIATFSLWFFIVARIYLSDSSQEQLVNSILLLLTIIVGVLLIGSVQREVDQKEKVEKLALDLEKANDKLKDLDQLKSEFLSLASHQLRGPLTAIKGYASEIIEGDFGPVPKNLENPVKTIFQSCDSLTDLVEDFLNISRIEQGRMKYEMTRFDFVELVNQVVNEIKPNIDNKGLELKTNMESQVFIFADKLKMKQIIGNLIDNSIKYTPKGSIFVSVFKKDNKAVLSIKDTGVGVKKETIEHLFKKFSRAEDASKANILGTGLGLYLAKQIITAHSGRIWVESEGEGKGSEFFVELQLA